MTGNELLEKMSLMDVTYVEKANGEPGRAVKGWHKWKKGICAAAACLVVAAVAGVLLNEGLSLRTTGDNGNGNPSSGVASDIDTEWTMIANQDESDGSDDESADVLTDDADDESTEVSADASANDGNYEETVEESVEKWEDMEIYRKYSVISVNDISYTAKSAEISADKIGEELATVTAIASYDQSELSEEEQTCEVQVYAIQNLSTECAVAVQYSDDEVCYAAVNTAYQPTTLAQLLEDMDLESTLEIGSVWCYEEGEGFSVELDQSGLDESETVESKIWEILYLDAKRTELQDYEKPENGVQISAKIPLVGYEISAGTGYGYVIMDVCEDGYLIISIPDTGDWVFDIGEDAAEKFISYTRSLEEF